MSRGATPDAWAYLRTLTRARIALGRAGGSLPTAELLGLSAAHAAARDAVGSALDLDRLEVDLAPAGLPPLRVRSQAPDRASYLQRPDLGRRLHPEDEAALAHAGGLTAAAAQRHGAAVAIDLARRLRGRGLSMGPLVLASQARVALEDPIGAALSARAALILLGERPGLGSADSLGAYLVFGPRTGRTDAERNCVSSIRPDGLAPAAAAAVLEWLAAEALRRRLSGVELKDERRALAPGLLAPRG